MNRSVVFLPDCPASFSVDIVYSSSGEAVTVRPSTENVNSGVTGSFHRRVPSAEDSVCSNSSRSIARHPDEHHR